jgi:predicted permease
MRWRRFLQRSRQDRDRDDEMRQHLQLAIDHYVGLGMTPENARRTARVRFGNLRAHREGVDEMNRLPLLDVLGRDVRYALRRIGQAPGFSATVIATLALAIGATGAVFSLADGILLQPLPLPEPSQLSLVAYQRGRGTLYTGQAVDGAMWEAVRDHVPAADAAIFSNGMRGINFVLDGVPSFVQGEVVGAGYFHVLGVQPLIGREFVADEARAGGAASVILSFAFWKRTFAMDPAAVGKTILLKGEPFTVVGVMPQTFTGIDVLGDPDVWTPLRGAGQGFNYMVIARPKPGATTAVIAAQLESLDPAATFRMLDPATDGYVRRLVPIQLQSALTESAREPIMMLSWAVGTVLLIACVNIAALLMARGGERTKEIATRMALGSGRTAVIRQLMVESSVLALIGGVLGVLVALVGLEGLKAVGGTTFSEWASVSLNGRTVAVGLILSAFTSVLFGLLPAWQTSRIDVQRSLTDGGSRSVAGSSRHILRRSLVVAEVALGVVMLVGAGLLLRQFLVLRTLDPGFNASYLYSVSASLQDARYKDPAVVNQLFSTSLERLQHTPGIDSAAVSQGLPYQRLLNQGFRLEVMPEDDNKTYITNITYATPQFFKTFGIDLLQGRGFEDRDRADMPPVAVVNKAFADFFLTNQVPVGRGLMFGRKRVEIVGVSHDVQTVSGFYLPGMRRGAISTAPTIYLPASQTEPGMLSYFPPLWTVRAVSASVAAEALTKAVNAADPLLPLNSVESIENVASKSIARPRLMMTLVGALALAALLLAAIGIHGLITHVVSERRREFGVRLALGAAASQIVRSVAMSGVVLALAGAVIGIGLSLLSAKLVEAFLTDLKTTDLITYVGVSLTLVLVALVSSLLPAMRIVSLDPAKTLRN